MTRLGDLFLIPEWTRDERENVARLLSRIESIALDLGSRIDAQGNATELRAGSVSLSPAGLVVTVAGVEKLRVDDNGLLLGNNLSTVLRFKAADGASSSTEGMQISSNVSDFLNLTNREAGKGIDFTIKTTAGATPQLTWKETGLAERVQLDLGVASQGTNLTIGGEVSIFGGVGGVETVFNEQGRDIDFRVEGDTATNLLLADAGLDAVQVGTTVAGAIADFRAATIVFNEAGADLDFRVEGDTNANVFNVDAGKDVAYFRGIGARVRRAQAAGNQTISHNTSTLVQFDTEVWDTDGLATLGTNNARLTCVTAGKYLIEAACLWEPNTTGVRQVRIRLNGTNYLDRNRVSAAGNGYADVRAITVYDLAVNDYVEMEVYQDSGGNLYIEATDTTANPYFLAQKVG